MDDKILISIGIPAVYFVLVWLRSRSFNQGRLAGIREAVTDVSRSCSYHYEEKDKPLPKNVDEALVYMAGALKRGRGVKGKIGLYLTGSGMLGDAMGEAAYQKGFDAGRSDPSDGEQRIDMTPESWRAIRSLAHEGFLHRMEGYEQEAHRAEAAIEKLEFAIRHCETDPEYSDSLQRNMLIWQRWPSEAQAAATGRGGINGREARGRG
jgi:hypothetical protein